MCYVFVFSELHYLPQTAYINETTYLLCGYAETAITPVDWFYYNPAQYNSDEIFIIDGGYVVLDTVFNNRLNISGSTLIINDVKPDDTGLYLCHENAGFGEEHGVNITVKGKLIERKVGATSRTG